MSTSGFNKDRKGNYSLRACACGCSSFVGMTVKAIILFSFIGQRHCPKTAQHCSNAAVFIGVTLGVISKNKIILGSNQFKLHKGIQFPDKP